MKNAHAHLLTIVKELPEDYAPWGKITDAQRAQRWVDCSCGCKWYFVLEDLGRGKATQPISMDWGVCTNPQSHRAGLLTFEHQGCFKFQPGRR